VFLGREYGPTRNAPPNSRRGISGADARKLRTEIGMVFQQFNLWPHMCVLDNVTLGLRKAKRMPRKEAEELAFAQLERVGIPEKARAYPGMLSGGQQQRVAIARALVMDPQLMLFDEPTSALDPELIGEVLAVMRELAREGMTMVVVTHEINFAAAIADQVIFMDHGVVVESGGPAVLTNPTSDRARTFFQSVLGREMG
jgi:polar amino acid transport system ATP-binding protein